MRSARFLGLSLAGVALTYLGLLRLAVWLDYWERQNRPMDPHRDYRHNGQVNVVGARHG